MGTPLFGTVESIIYKICHVCGRIAGVILTLLVLTLVGDTIGRFIGYPIVGSFELVQYGFALIVCISVAYTDIQGGHIAIDLFFNRFPKVVRILFTKISKILSFVVSVLIIWRLISNSIDSFGLYERSSTLQVPIFSFSSAIAFGFAILALVQITKFVKSMGAK